MGKVSYNNSTQKKRDPMISYHNKVKRMTKWYEHLQKERSKELQINPNTKDSPKIKTLKSLDYYLSKIKKPQGESK